MSSNNDHPRNEGRAAIVTGGGTGIGRAIVKALTSAGVNCLVTGRRMAPLEDTAADLKEAPGSVEAVAGDVAVAADRQRMVEQCIRRFGRLDVLVNNAGTSSWAPLLDYPEDSWREVMGTNLEGPFFLTQAAVAEMRRRRWGRVINIASVYASLALNNYFYGDRMPAESAGDRGPVRASAYHASKSGLLTMTKDLAVAVARWGITVNTVSPGMLMTDLADNLLDDEVRRRIEEMTPLGRFGRPEEVGYAVRFLASEESSFITGTELVIDGGWSIW